MTDEEFEELKLTIEILSGKLEIAQKRYTQETGQPYVVPFRLNRSHLLEDCIQWSKSGKTYKPLIK